MDDVISGTGHASYLGLRVLTAVLTDSEPERAAERLRAKKERKEKGTYGHLSDAESPLPHKYGVALVQGFHISQPALPLAEDHDQGRETNLRI